MWGHSLRAACHAQLYTGCGDANNICVCNLSKVVMASQVKSACCQVQQTRHANVEVQHAVYVMCREYVWLYPKTSIHDTARHQQYIAAHLLLYGATIWMLDAA